MGDLNKEAPDQGFAGPILLCCWDVGRRLVSVKTCEGYAFVAAFHQLASSPEPSSYKIPATASATLLQRIRLALAIDKCPDAWSGKAQFHGLAEPESVGFFCVTTFNIWLHASDVQGQASWLCER